MNAIPHVRASFCSWLLSRPAGTPRTRFLFRVVGEMADPVNGAAVGDEMDAEQDNPTGGVTYLCGGEYRYFFFTWHHRRPRRMDGRILPRF